jgi:hypothetical protein
VADFHRVKTPTPLEFPPPTTRPAAQPTAWDWLVLYVVRPLWGLRVELAAGLLLLAAWPWLDAERCLLWRPVPVGVDEDGHWVSITLPERHVLLGGESGAGKSGGLALLLAAAALDPSVRLVLLDGKLVELACWAGVADRSVGPDPAEAVAVLQQVQAELDRRLLALLANRRRKLSPSLGLPLLLVVIDELALYVAGPDRRLAAEFAARLRDLVARGRAAGIIVCAATQKPAHEVIPTALRDLFGFRWAFRCLTPQASDTILGAGWASLGYAASTIDAADRGVGLLLAEGGLPVRLRGPAGWTTTSSPSWPPGPSACAQAARPTGRPSVRRRTPCPTASRGRRTDAAHPPGPAPRAHRRDRRGADRVRPLDRGPRPRRGLAGGVPVGPGAAAAGGAAARGAAGRPGRSRPGRPGHPPPTAAAWARNRQRHRRRPARRRLATRGEGPGVGRPTIGTGRRPLPPPPQGVTPWHPQLYPLPPHNA